LQYLVVSVCGYAALGNDVPASIMLGFDSAPIWVTLLANFMVLVHMVPAYQVRVAMQIQQMLREPASTRPGVAVINWQL
jgi:amino acid permease